MDSGGSPAAHFCENGGVPVAGKKTEYRRIRMDSGHHRRIRLTAAVLGLLAFVPMALRLYDLMVVNYDYYAREALRNQTRTTYVTAMRGAIYDRNMNTLAASVGVENVYLDPHELKQSKADLSAIAAFLGELLDVDPESIEKKGTQSLYHIHVILYGLTADVHNDLRIIFFQERNISLHEYVNAGVLQTDGIEHTAVYFCHTRGRVAGPGHIGYTLGHHRTQAVQIYEFFIFHAGAKGSGCCHYGVFESYSCNRCLCIHQISTSSASNTGPSVQILALCT